MFVPGSRGRGGPCRPPGQNGISILLRETPLSLMEMESEKVKVQKRLSTEWSSYGRATCHRDEDATLGHPTGWSHPVLQPVCLTHPGEHQGVQEDQLSARPCSVSTLDSRPVCCRTLRSLCTSSTCQPAADVEQVSKECPHHEEDPGSQHAAAF